MPCSLSNTFQHSYRITLSLNSYAEKSSCLPRRSFKVTIDEKW